MDAKMCGKSILEDTLGALPDTWNVGLFRFLDEAIYLFRILDYYSIAAMIKDNSKSSQMILCHQVENNLLAVRALCALGLDGPARQNLRTLYEMCHALCRCLVDPDFMAAFSNQPTLKSANEFWHRFMAKQKTEKFLIDYNSMTENKCLLVVGELFQQAYPILGVGAHPNYHGWVIDWTRSFDNARGLEEIFYFSPTRASELVISTACQLALITLTFAAEKVSEISVSVGMLTANEFFRHYSDDKQALKGIGNVAGLMSLMLTKWTNRNSPNYDPAMHF